MPHAQHMINGESLRGLLTRVGGGAYIPPPIFEHTFDPTHWKGRSGAAQRERVRPVTKLYEDLVSVERDAGMPSAFVWRGRRYEVRDVIGRWRIEGRWWEDGRDREYWRVEAKGGMVLDLYEDRRGGRWHLERLWD